MMASTLLLYASLQAAMPPFLPYNYYLLLCEAGLWGLPIYLLFPHPAQLRRCCCRRSHRWQHIRVLILARVSESDR